MNRVVVDLKGPDDLVEPAGDTREYGETFLENRQQKHDSICDLMAQIARMVTRLEEFI